MIAKEARKDSGQRLVLNTARSVSGTRGNETERTGGVIGTLLGPFGFLELFLRLPIASDVLAEVVENPVEW